MATVPETTETKWFFQSKRFWALIAGIAINVALLVLVNGMTLKDALSDEKTMLMGGLVVAMLMQAGGYASTVKGSKPAALRKPKS
jgi:hypothetical protein